jgi:mono/diheme cytochrome c family protein
MRSRIALAVAGVALGALAALSHAQTPRAPAPPPRRAPAHATHGTPAGWRFAWPKGDARKGREVFAKYGCFSCHEVRGERFPATKDAVNVGPELSAMGPLHEAAYFAEAIVNPGAVIEPGRGYQAPDGSSRMPSYNDTMTVQEVVDLVAYLRALRPPPGTPAPAHRPGGRTTH